MEKKIVRTSIILCFLFLSTFNLGIVGLCNGCSLWQRLAYPFVHNNIWHAAANAYALWQCFKIKKASKALLLSFYAVAISFPFTVTEPIVGLSGMVFAYMGYLAPYVVNRWRFNFVVLLYIGAGLLFPNVAVALHLYCYVAGIVIGCFNVPLWKEK